MQRVESAKKPVSVSHLFRLRNAHRIFVDHNKTYKSCLDATNRPNNMCRTCAEEHEHTAIDTHAHNTYTYTSIQLHRYYRDKMECAPKLATAFTKFCAFFDGKCMR